MNYLSLMPDDVLEIIYKNIHNDFMKNIKIEIDDELDVRWNRLNDDEKNEYIDTHYETKYARFCIYDENEELIRPESIAFEGFYRFIERIIINYDDDDYDFIEDSDIEYDEETDEYYILFISKIMYNPSYVDILLEVDKYIKITGDYDHHFLEDVYIEGVCDEIGVLKVFLGS